MEISTKTKSEKEYKRLTEIFVVALCSQNSINIDRTNLIFAFDSHFMFDSTVNCASMVIIRIVVLMAQHRADSQCLRVCCVVLCS